MLTTDVPVPAWLLAALAVAVPVLVAAGYWCGRLDRRDQRVLAGIGENDARFERMRRYAAEQKARLIGSLARLAAARDPRQAFHTIAAELVLTPNDDRRDGDDWPNRDDEPRGTAELAVWSTRPEERIGKHRWDLLDADTGPLSHREVVSANGMRGAA